MEWFIALVGLFYIMAGILGLIATKRTALALGNLIKNTSQRTLGLWSLIFGILLLISSGSARETWFILALGIIACLKGAMVILISKQKLKAIIDWKLSAPETVYKYRAAFLIVLGVVIFYVI